MLEECKKNVLDYDNIFTYLNQEYSRYDISDPEVFKKHLIPDSHPVKMKLDRLFEDIHERNKMNGFLDRCYYQPLSMRDIKVVKETDTRFILKINDTIGSFFMKGLYKLRIGRYGEIYEYNDLFRVPMREIMHDIVLAYKLQEEIDLPKKYYYHIPGYPEEISPLNYMTLAEGSELMCKDEDLPKLPEMTKEMMEKDPETIKKLHQSLRIFDAKSHMPDQNPTNIRLDKEGKRFVVLDTDPLEGWVNGFFRYFYKTMDKLSA
jgi:hypothetical protein